MKLSRPFPIILLVLWGAGLLSACGKGGSFSEVTESIQALSASQASHSKTANPQEGGPEGGIPVIRLLTPNVQNNSANESIKYLVAFVKDTPTTVEIPIDKVTFDNNGALSIPKRFFNFTVTSPDNPSLLMNGQLNLVVGSDSFGNWGSGWSHFESPNGFTIPVGIRSIVISIDFSNSSGWGGLFARNTSVTYLCLSVNPSYASGTLTLIKNFLPITFW